MRIKELVNLLEVTDANNAPFDYKGGYALFNSMSISLH